MPVKTEENFKYSVVNDLQINDETRALIEISIKELKEEITLVKELL